ncbi:MAG TPA: metallopeptidase family protein [Alphaproteobacteria bacterium]|jgi:predicted Zn-dependent protease with MMP-like domain
MDRQQIIMSFSVPPTADDLQVIAKTALLSLPEELMEFCEGLGIQIEELPDLALEQELELETAYDLVALFRSGSQLAPGVESKVANDDDIIILFRRPLLDMWCESGEDLNALVRQVMIDELGAHFDFSDDEIEEMSGRHYQGML